MRARGHPINKKCNLPLIHRCRSSILIGMANWLRDLFPEVTQRRRDLDVPLQTRSAGKEIATHTIQWITRRNYESMHAK